MELSKHCAYNQTRECFLGLEVEIVDLPNTNLERRFASLALKSGEGLWIKPFRGMLKTGIQVPLDLLFLDEDCRVVDGVESFPSFRIPPLGPQVASVLVLASHSIYSSQTQPGDQLLICAAGEMERHLERFTRPNIVASSVQSFSAEKAEAATNVVMRPGMDRSPTQPATLKGTDEKKGKVFKAPKNWLERLLSPDPRRAPRDMVTGLSAYYWTNAAPQAHSVRDISSTGLYLITEERWYPGTLVLMTLQDTEDKEQGNQHLLSVYSKVVRWGDDGVGLQFVLQDTRANDRDSAGVGMNRKEIDQFLERLRKSGKTMG